MNYMRVFQSSRFFRKNKTSIIFGGLVLVSLALGHKDIERNMSNIAQIKAEIAQNNQSQQQLEQQLEREAQQAKIAETRYKRGCTVVVSKRSPRNLATLVEGEGVLDRTTKKFLPLGVVVCDANGTTGVIVRSPEGKPVVGLLAVTGNRELAIAQIKKIRGARLYYNTPENGQ